jgi:phosphonate transport system substrate-binding protein
VLRRWRRGSDQYHSVLFGLADSGITSPDDLLGKMIAMDNPFSTSGYMLPAATLLEQGYKLSVKETYEDPVAEDEIGIVFSYDDENTFQWVVSGLVSAGATDNVSYESFSADLDTGLSIFAETRPVPRQVVLMRSDIDPALAAAIIDLLVNISDDPQAQAVLQAFDGTTRFDEFPEGLAAAQEQMRSMMELVKQIKLPE